MNDIESRVARGIALLDSKSPAWRTMIDRDNLNMSDRVACIIGQVFDVQDNTEIGNECFVQYREAVSALGLASGTEHASGFDLSPSEYDTYWAGDGPDEALWGDLEAEWLRQMDAPRHADYPHEPGTLYDCGSCEDIMRDEIELAERGEL